MGEVYIPVRSSGGGGRPRRSVIPTAAHVPTVQPQRDPGVNVPDFGKYQTGLGEIAEGVSEFSAVVQKENERNAAYDLAGKITKYDEESALKLAEINDQPDISNTEAATTFGKFQSDRKAALVAEHAKIGTHTSMARLQLRLDEIESNHRLKAATLAAETGRARLTNLAERDLGGLVDLAQQDPGRAFDAVQRWHDRIDDLAMGFGETQAKAVREHGSALIATSAIGRVLSGGDVDGAEKMFHAASRNGFFDPDTAAVMQNKITDTRLRKNEIQFRLAQLDAAVTMASSRGIVFTPAEHKKMVMDAISGGKGGVTVNVGGGEGGAGALTSGPVKGALMTRDIDLSLKLLDSMGDVERAVGSVIPTTDAFTLRNTIESIQGRLAFDNLMHIKRTSGTGLGALSEGELKALSGLAGSLSVGLSKAVLQSNLRDLRNVIAAAEAGDENLIRLAVGKAISKDPLAGLPEGTQDNGDGTYTLPDGTVVRRKAK